MIQRLTPLGLREWNVWRVLTLAALLVAAALVSPANAQTFPKLTGRVVDNANLLDPAQEVALTAKLEALESQSGRQMVIATLPDLQGYEIEEYGYQLGREWGIGQAASGSAEKDNGVLLIVAPNERKVRIEVGYGLEGILTDALSSIIIQQEILPRFRNNDYPGGIAAGTDSVISQLTLPDDEARAFAAQAEADARKAQEPEPYGVMFGFAVLFFLFFVLPALTGAKGGRRYSGAGAAAITTWGGSSGSSWGGGGGFSGGGGSFGGGGSSGGW